MNSKTWVICLLMILAGVGVCLGDEGQPPPAPSTGHGEDCSCMFHRESLSGNWFSLGEQLEEQGITVALSRWLSVSRRSTNSTLTVR
jgi:hypothetical protein